MGFAKSWDLAMNCTLRRRYAATKKRSRKEKRFGAPSAVVSDTCGTTTGTPRMSAWNFVSHEFKTAPPSARSSSSLPPEASSAAWAREVLRTRSARDRRPRPARRRRCRWCRSSPGRARGSRAGGAAVDPRDVDQLPRAVREAGGIAASGAVLEVELHLDHLKARPYGGDVHCGLHAEARGKREEGTEGAGRQGAPAPERGPEPAPRG